MSTTRPQLSLVACGRNDNQNGDFERRAEYAIRHNVALLTGRKIPFELVWVEWNSTPDRPRLAVRVKAWAPGTRVVVVPPAVHAHLCDNPSIGVMQFHAKNAGIRRARGEWILSLNADTYLTPDVVARLRGRLERDTLYLAERVDFDSEALDSAPAEYPIAGLGARRVVRVDKIALPHSIGSAGDFTLMHRGRWLQLGGHYEGIRFSNLHMDTLLGWQHAAAAGRFEVLGRVFHADHKDSWNNFTASDDRRHHGGCNYDIRQIQIPYVNPVSWGLADFREIADADCTVLAAPAGLVLRRELPEQILIPEELRRLVQFADRFQRAVDDLKKSGKRVLLYGLGEQVRRAVERGELEGVQLVGYVDDNGKTSPGLTIPSVTWDQAAAIGYDAVLIGSFYWADQLRGKAESRIPAGMIVP